MSVEIETKILKWHKRRHNYSHFLLLLDSPYLITTIMKWHITYLDPKRDDWILVNDRYALSFVVWKKSTARTFSMVQMWQSIFYFLWIVKSRKRYLYSKYCASQNANGSPRSAQPPEDPIERRSVNRTNAFIVLQILLRLTIFGHEAHC